MKSKWFDDVFLQLIFDRIGTNTEKWLTAKQTAVCTRYMKRHTARIESAYGYQNHDNYTYTWNGREVWLSYSKKNGCGTIWFGYNAEEQEHARIANEANRLHQIAESARRRLKLHPDKYAERVEKLKIEISLWQDEIDESVSEGDFDGIENLQKHIDELQEKLDIWERIAKE